MATEIKFKIKPLPFADGALAPIISAKTISHHYYKHHVGYVNKLNDLLDDNDNRTLEQILKDEQDPSGNISIWNNAAQHYNHEFYWESLSPSKQQIPEVLEKKITESFGSAQEMYDKIVAMSTTVFGSGWVWLTANSADGKLQLEKTSNANMPENRKLLVLDVWEHAYYLDYQQNRANHIKDLAENHLNWEKALERLLS